MENKEEDGIKYLIINGDLRPQFNLALEEYALTGMDMDMIMLWRNSASVIIGCNQNAVEEIDASYVKENGIPVVRRQSGGGAVFHDLGNVNFTVINKLGGDDFNNYRKFTAPIISYLSELGVSAEFQGRNDLVIDGMKFCGNAQAVKKNRIMHHGCILYSADVSRLAGALRPKRAKIESKGVKSVRKRVTNIADHLPEPIPVEVFLSGLASYFIKNVPGILPYGLTDSDISAAEKLMREKYETWEWNFGRSPDYNMEREGRYDSGTVSVKLFVERGIIREIHIFGDFFGLLDKSALEETLTGIRHEKPSVKAALEGANIGMYMSGISASQLAELICQI
ncbi:MAG: lipoate--protein ligase [Synergistaceae bacterium]|jgi:lipoate-protein ligase A|nr:lipoate--protein ligase [Synergistaceae bacterium]